MPFLGFLILAWVLSRVEGTAMWKALDAVSLKTLALATACFCINILIKGLRWRRMLEAQRISIPTSVVFSAYLNAIFFGQITIGRVGEFLRVEALTERNVPLGRALSSCLFDRLMDVLFVLSLGTILSALVIGNAQTALIVASILFGIVLSGILVFVLIERDLIPVQARSWISKIMGKAEQRPVLRGFAQGLRDLWQGSVDLIRILPLLEAMFWTVAAWLGYFGTLWILAEGQGVDVSRTILVAAASLAALSSLLPITISGIGVRELVFAEILRIEGASIEQAVILSLINLTVMTTAALGLGVGGMVWRQRQAH